jgi:hypothetical protein
MNSVRIERKRPLVIYKCRMGYNIKMNLKYIMRACITCNLLRIQTSGGFLTEPFGSTEGGKLLDYLVAYKC